jgi:hypothetical protein
MATGAALEFLANLRGAFLISFLASMVLAPLIPAPGASCGVRSREE